MIRRTLQSSLEALVRDYPVVCLTGPRQSGKTTLCRATFPGYDYLSLEDLQTREEATEDPRGFLRRFEGRGGVVLDEIQRAPDLFSYLLGFVDEERGGPFVLTGSQHFLLSERISQSLAGRSAILELLPFSLAELEGREPVEAADLCSPSSVPPAAPSSALNEVLFTGMYPRIHDRGLEPTRWLDGYVQTYVERDVRTLTNVGDLDTFSRFVSLCAGRAGQLLNLSSLGADAGVSQPTAKKWLSILRTSYVVDLLQPHHQNFRKRLVKSPKLYFVDTGLLCFLLGIEHADQLRTHPLRGAIFENFVVQEQRKTFLHTGRRAPIFFWRDSNGREIDLVIDIGKRRIPVEIKAGETLASAWFKTLDAYIGLSGDQGGVLFHGGDAAHPRGRHMVRPWWG